MGEKAASWLTKAIGSFSGSTWQTKQRRLQTVWFPIMFVALLASCGGGYSPPMIGYANPQATPIVPPSSAPAMVVQQASVSLPAASAGATPKPVVLPAVAGPEAHPEHAAHADVGLREQHGQVVRPPPAGQAFGGGEGVEQDRGRRLDAAHEGEAGHSRSASVSAALASAWTARRSRLADQNRS